MKQLVRLRFLLLTGMLATIMPGIVNAQISWSDYTVTKRVELSLSGEKKIYQFHSDWLEGRFNNRLRRFEFRMPFQYVKAVQNAADLSVFNSVFLNGPDAVPDDTDMMQLMVYLPDGTQNFDAYRNPATLTLAADCIINGKTYRTPIAMNLFYTNNLLKYGLDLNMDTILNTVASNANVTGGPLNRMQLLVRESEMKVSFEQ